MSMRSCIASSADHLRAEERRVFTALGVFPASFDLDAAKAIVLESMSRLPMTLERLVDMSLLDVREPQPPTRSGWRPRFSMLRTTRMWANEQHQSADELTVLRERHASYYEALAAKSMEGGREPRLAMLDQEEDNLRVAIGHFASSEQFARAVLIAMAMSSLWEAAGVKERGSVILRSLHVEELPPEVRLRVVDQAVRLAGLDDQLSAGPRDHEPAEIPAAEARQGDTVLAVPSVLALLTPREIEVATLVAEGLTNRAIARRLSIAEWTAVNHVRSVMWKLNCPSRVHVANWINEQHGNPG